MIFTVTPTATTATPATDDVKNKKKLQNLFVLSIDIPSLPPFPFLFLSFFAILPHPIFYFTFPFPRNLSISLSFVFTFFPQPTFERSYLTFPLSSQSPSISFPSSFFSFPIHFRTFLPRSSPFPLPVFLSLSLDDEQIHFTLR